MKKIEIDWTIVGTIAFLLLILAIPIFASIKEKSDTYKALLSNIENKEWIEAKSNLDSLGDYKNTLELSPEVNYQYYLKNANEQYNKKEYHQALNEYKNALTYKSGDKNLEIKIKEVEQICKKLDEEKRRKEELERKKAEQERLKAEREEAQRNREELAELQRLVNRSFVKTNFLNTGGGGSGFRFYTYPESWNQLDYVEKQNVCNACARYVELKFNVSRSHAREHTWIVNLYNDSLMTYCE